MVCKYLLKIYIIEPIGEHVVSYGPFVMNSDKEIRDAFLIIEALALADGHGSVMILFIQ